MFTTLYVSPRNPRHFISLCFLFIKDHPELKANNKLSKKVWEKNNLAVFRCAYGYFLVDKDGRVSKEFYSSLKEIIIKTKKAPLK